MNKLFYILIIGLFVAFACDDFFEEDLGGKSVVLVAPVDGLETSNSSFTFWWDELNGASKYNLQIVSPGFDAIEKLVLDTNLTGNQYEAQLYPGFFEWRVKAFNSSSETPYTIHSLSVDSTLDLSGQEVILYNPENNSATNQTSLTFTWEKIYNATEYNIKIKKGDWDTGSNILNELIEDDSYTQEDFTEGTYYWGVQAKNNNSATNFDPWEFIVDLTAPHKPTLITPIHEDTTSTNVSFSWERPDESGSIITDSLYVSIDSNFEGDHEIAISRTVTSYSTTFDVASGSSKKYYWRVRSIDAAGNNSDNSISEFTIKNEK